jgi:hypothetical protein
VLTAVDPEKYGPFLKDASGHTVLSASGRPQVDTSLVALLPVSIQLARNNIQQWLATQPSPEQATSTIVNLAASPVQSQPQLSKALAIGILLGLILGALIALTLPRPPNRGAPAIDLQP